MNNEVIIAILTVVASAIGSLSLVNWRITQLEKKVDQHNQYSDKMANIEKDTALIKQDLQYIKDRLDNN